MRLQDYGGSAAYLSLFTRRRPAGKFLGRIKEKKGYTATGDCWFRDGSKLAIRLSTGGAAVGIRSRLYSVDVNGHGLRVGIKSGSP